MGFHAHLPPPPPCPEILSAGSSCRPCVYCHNGCGFICATALLCLVNTVSSILARNLGSYRHPTPSSWETPESLGKTVIWTSHLGPIPYSLQADQLVFIVLFFLIKYKIESVASAPSWGALFPASPELNEAGLGRCCPPRRAPQCISSLFK